MVAGRQVYFAGIFSPNEGEEGQSVEFAILRWDLGSASDIPAPSSKLPYIRVHSFLSPSMPNRLRWGILNEHGIDPKLLQKNATVYPSEADLLAEDYLKGRHTVVFDGNREIMRRLVNTCSAVDEIVSMWQEVFADSDDERFKTASTPDEMLSYLNLPTVSEVAYQSHHYTRLLCELYATAALWATLRFLKSHPRKISEILQSSLPINGLWPVSEAPDFWFEGEHSSLATFSADEIEKFFSGNTQDYIDWRHTNIYIHDWNYRQRITSRISQEKLPQASAICNTIFNRMFSVDVQLWILVYYAVFSHKSEYASEIAVRNGDFSLLQDSIREDFTNFLMRHLKDFLGTAQKKKVLADLFNSSLTTRNKYSYQQYNYKQEKQKQLQDRQASPYFLFQEPSQSSVCYFEEIRRYDRTPAYRHYIISGHNEERRMCEKGVSKLFNKFLLELKDPYAPVWLDKDFQGWIEYVTGVGFGEICRQPRMHDSADIIAARALVSEVVATETTPYILRLRELLTREIQNIASSDDREYHSTFVFMGVSVEITVRHRSQVPFFKRIFNFR